MAPRCFCACQIGESHGELERKEQGAVRFFDSPRPVPIQGDLKDVLLVLDEDVVEDVRDECFQGDQRARRAA